MAVWWPASRRCSWAGGCLVGGEAPVGGLLSLSPVRGLLSLSPVRGRTARTLTEDMDFDDPSASMPHGGRHEEICGQPIADTRRDYDTDGRKRRYAGSLDTGDALTWGHGHGRCAVGGHACTHVYADICAPLCNVYLPVSGMSIIEFHQRQWPVQAMVGVAGAGCICISISAHGRTRVAIRTVGDTLHAACIAAGSMLHAACTVHACCAICRMRGRQYL